MSRIAKLAATCCIMSLVAVAAFAQGQRPDPNSPRYKGLVALSEFLGSDDDQAVHEFIVARIAPSVHESMDAEELFATLKALRAEAAGAEMRGGRPISELAAEVLFDTSDGTELAIEFELDESDNDRFVYIRSPGNTIGG